jgi:hypothetical protein
MTMNKVFNVISPDGIPITPQPFSSFKAAEKYIPRWVRRYECQGYYATAGGERIPLADLSSRVVIVEETR